MQLKPPPPDKIYSEEWVNQERIFRVGDKVIHAADYHARKGYSLEKVYVVVRSIPQIALFRSIKEPYLDITVEEKDYSQWVNLSIIYDNAINAVRNI